MIDIDELKKSVDLLSLLEWDGVKLRKVANTAGGEYAAPCPFCGGSKRLKVQPHRPDGGRWFCRHCSSDPLGGGRWHDVLDYIQRRDGCDFMTAVRTALGYGRIPTNRTPSGSGLSARSQTNPPQAFQDDAAKIMQQCGRLLWSPTGAPALHYLHGPGRGLKDDTIHFWRLGYSPGAKIAGRYVPPGVVIPSVVDGTVWRLKVRLINGLRFNCQHCRKHITVTGPCPYCGQDNRYRSVVGSVESSLFGIDSLPGRDMAVLCEGEFNAMILWQECRDLTGVVSVGSAKGAIDLKSWDKYLLPISRWYAVFDPDSPGDKAAATWTTLSARITRLMVPRLNDGDKDISDFRDAGGDVRRWILSSTGMSLHYTKTAEPILSTAKLTVTWPPRAKVPTIRGQWRRLPSGDIEATYIREELAICMGMIGGLNKSDVVAALG